MKFSPIFLALLILLLSPHSSLASIQSTQTTSHASNDFKLLTYNPQKSMVGLNAFVLWERDNTIPTWVRSIVTVMNMEGKFIATHVVDDGTNLIYESEMFNTSTVMYITLGDHTPHLWNFKTNVVENLSFPAGYHDIEYNAINDTFLVKRINTWGSYQGLKIQHHDLYEYSHTGEELWYWNASQHLPFNPELWQGETFGGEIEYVHANSIFWDVEPGKIYYNSKNLDTFYRIDKSSGSIDWGVGRVGNFTLYNQAGEKVDSLWYHAHAVERIGPDRFILYDNDDMNLSRADPSSPGISRMVEIVVDEQAGTAKEVWSYAAPPDHYSPVWGDADRLPNGNSIGSFGHYSHAAYLTEVDHDGDVVWEVAFERSETRSWGIFRIERFLEKPLISVNRKETDTGVNLQLSVWNTIRTRIHVPAHIEISHDSETLVSEEFRFNPHWQATILSYNLTGYDKQDLTITITNNEGITSTMLSSYVETSSTSPAPIFLFGTLTVALIVLRRRR